MKSGCGKSLITISLILFLFMSLPACGPGSWIAAVFGGGGGSSGGGGPAASTVQGPYIYFTGKDKGNGDFDIVVEAEDVAHLNISGISFDLVEASNPSISFDYDKDYSGTGPFFPSPFGTLGCGIKTGNPSVLCVGSALKPGSNPSTSTNKLEVMHIRLSTTPPSSGTQKTLRFKVENLNVYERHTKGGYKILLSDTNYDYDSSIIVNLSG